jgi:hypothetical protein
MIERLEAIRIAARKLQRLLDEPEPGLMSWLAMVKDAGEQLHTALAKEGFCPYEERKL